MRQPFDLAHNSCLFLTSALALTLSACNSDVPAETESASSSGSSGDSTTDTPTTNPPTTDPNTTEPVTTTDPVTTTTPTTTETSTTEPVTTTDTSTTNPVETDTDPAETDTDPVETDTDPGETDTGTGTSTDTGDTDTGGGLQASAVWATQNPTGLGTDALVGAPPTLAQKTPTLSVLGDVVSIQSVGLRGNGDGVITYDAPGGAGGLIIDVGHNNNPMNGALGLGDRVIRGAATGLKAPKGVEAAAQDGLILVADTGAAKILAFDFDDVGDVAPQFEISDLGSSAAVWDVHYEADSDTLYAAGTNGEVQVYENFTMDQGQMGPDRTIVPTVNGAKVSVNLHGVTIDNDFLFLSDVGDAMNAADGQLFVIDGADAADGNVAVTQRIQGGMLGNPVDIEFRGGVLDRLYVAEKSNDALLVYQFDLLDDEFQFDSSLKVTKPESVAIGSGTTLVVASNPAGLDMDASLAINSANIGDPTLTATRNQLGSVTSVQSVVLADNGDAYVGFDGPAVTGGGGVFVVPALTAINKDGPTSAVASRIWGPKTKLITPKGMALTAAQDLLIVADTGGMDIKVFATDALGDSAPVFEVDDLGGGPVWDVHHDADSDLLFAAGTNGTVRVFEEFLANKGAGGPARTITPVDEMGDKISVNLHGIHYDAASNTLILSDVGDAMSASDGQLFVIADASTADDDVEVKLQIGGDQTKLGNPVDLSFDGFNVYIAEKSNSFLLRIDGLLGLSGFINEPADVQLAVTNPESVQLVIPKP